MQITILAVGKLKEDYLRRGVAEYLKRLAGYARVEIIEVADEKAPENLSPAQRQAVLEREAARLDKYFPADALKVALAIEGHMFSSEEMATWLAGQVLAGRSKLAFIIGGSLGLAPSLLARADLRLSFSRLTFPHQLMRLILLEQLYRAFKINKGEPYHK